jgi:hypothetical protein
MILKDDEKYSHTSFSLDDIDVCVAGVFLLLALEFVSVLLWLPRLKEKRVQNYAHEKLIHVITNQSITVIK